MSSLSSSVPSMTLLHNLSPALLPKQPSHLLSARTPCPCPQLLALFIWAECFSVVQSASPWHIRQCCILPARPAHSASSTNASSTTTVSLPGRCSAAGFRIQRALGGANGRVAGGNECTWRRERILGGLIRGGLGFWLRAVPGTGSS